MRPPKQEGGVTVGSETHGGGRRRGEDGGVGEGGAADVEVGEVGAGGCGQQTSGTHVGDGGWSGEHTFCRVTRL